MAGSSGNEVNHFYCHNSRVTSEFKSFMKSNGIKHIRCAPYHPSSNGAAERFVQSFKRAIKASERADQSFHQRLMNFLPCLTCFVPMLKEMWCLNKLIKNFDMTSMLNSGSYF